MNSQKQNIWLVMDVLLYQIVASTICGKMIEKQSKCKLSAPTRNDKFELPGGSYSVSDIPDYFEYFIKNHERVCDKPPITIYVNTIEYRMTFKIKTGYYLNVLTP